MTRFLLTLATAISSAFSLLAAQDRPNILFIFSDDHAYQAISAYGSNRNQTPNLDRIAKEGMLFKKCYVTNSICGPSRAVIQTGKYSHLNGFKLNGDRFNGDQQTFPKLLRNAGYETAIIGKWHLVSDPQGFDYWKVLPGQGHYYNPDFITPGGTETIEGYVTDIITDVSLDWLKNSRDKEKPFLLMLQHKAPHREWEPGPNHLTLFDGEDLPEPDTLFDDYQGRGTAAKTQDMSIAQTMTMGSDLKVWEAEDMSDIGVQRAKARTYGRMNDAQRAAWDAAYGPGNKQFVESNLKGKDLVRWKYQRYMKDYLRCVQSVDDNVGRVLDYLEETGLAGNTVVIYSSDQGFYLGEHGWFDKRFMYSESYGTPLVARWPGVIKPGGVDDRHIVSNLDFPETFLDIAGVPIPGDMQGASLVPLFKGEDPANWRQSHYYHYYEFPAVHSVRRHEGVCNGRYKLIYFYDLDEWELFDLEKDPGEMKSEYENPEYAPQVAELKQELARLRKELAVPDEYDALKEPRQPPQGPAPKKPKA